MMILKWFCFILLCLDTVKYIIDMSKIGAPIGLCLGIAARVYALYGTAAYWLFA